MTTPKRTLTASALNPSTAFAAVLVPLLVVYGLWLLTCWPGVLGEDSLAIMLQVEGHVPFESGKPVFWYLFINALYGETLRVEFVTGVQLLISAAVFARILSWCWIEGLRKTFWVLLVLVALAPHVIFFQSALYSDGLFAVATTGMLFEIWLVAKRRRISAASLISMLVLLPKALFLRGNGNVLALSALAAWPFLSGVDKRKLALIFIGWIALHAWANHHFKLRSHGVLYPLALFETVNFLQPKPMNIRLPHLRVTPKTFELLTSTGQSLDKIISSFDRDYWDTLYYHATGPMLHLTKDAEKALVKEFFRTNLWRNVPAFVSSRVNVFLVSFLGMGGFPGVNGAYLYLPRTSAQSEVTPFNIGQWGKVATAIYDFSFRHRWILWTPLWGILLAFVLLNAALKHKDRTLFWIVAPLLAQLAGIFFFSIAGEYRYLLMFYVSTAALLPMLVMHRKERVAPSALS